MNVLRATCRQRVRRGTTGGVCCGPGHAAAHALTRCCCTRDTAMSDVCLHPASHSVLCHAHMSTYSHTQKARCKHGSWQLQAWQGCPYHTGKQHGPHRSSCSLVILRISSCVYCTAALFTCANSKAGMSMSCECCCLLIRVLHSVHPLHTVQDCQRPALVHTPFGVQNS